jgi:hypothetical protein
MPLWELKSLVFQNFEKSFGEPNLVQSGPSLNFWRGSPKKFQSRVPFPIWKFETFNMANWMVESQISNDFQPLEHPTKRVKTSLIEICDVVMINSFQELQLCFLEIPNWSLYAKIMIPQNNKIYNLDDHLKS